MDWVRKINVKLTVSNDLPQDDRWLTSLQEPGACFCRITKDFGWPFNMVLRYNNLRLKYPYVFISLEYFSVKNQSDIPDFKLKLDLLKVHNPRHQLVMEQARCTLLVAYQLKRAVIIENAVLNAFNLYFTYCSYCAVANCPRRLFYGTLETISNAKTVHSLRDLAIPAMLGTSLSIKDAFEKCGYLNFEFYHNPSDYMGIFNCVYSKLNADEEGNEITIDFSDEAADPENALFRMCLCPMNRSRTDRGRCFMKSAPQTHDPDVAPLEMFPCELEYILSSYNNNLAQKIFGNIAAILRATQCKDKLHHVATIHGLSFCSSGDSIVDYFDFVDIIGETTIW